MNKQQLNVALALVYAEPRYRDFIGAETRHQSVELILAAARLVERLLPGECLVCMGTGEHPNDVPWPCPVCHGSGQVWDEGIVEAVAKALPDSEHFSTDEDYHQAARSVLSAIAQLAEAGSQ